MSWEPWSVPRCWPGEIAVVAANGPSLCAADLDACRGRARVLCIGHAYRLAPWADWLHGSDPDRFWTEDEPEALHFPGTRTVNAGVKRDQQRSLLDRLHATGVHVLRHDGEHEGLSDDPGVLRGTNGVHQAISVLVFAGVRSLVLLGADMRLVNGRSHWHEGHRRPVPFELVVPALARLAGPLRERGIRLLNATPGSPLLRYYPTMPLADALSAA